MGLEFAVFCERHREALMLSKAGRRLFPGDLDPPVKRLDPDQIPRDIADLRYPGLLERVLALTDAFAARHSGCALSICHEKNALDWPWSGDWTGRIDWPRIPGGLLHPSGWTEFDVFRDTEWVNRYFRRVSESSDRPFERPELEEFRREAVDLAEVLRTRPLGEVTGSLPRRGEPGRL